MRSQLTAARRDGRRASSRPSRAYLGLGVANMLADASIAPQHQRLSEKAALSRHAWPVAGIGAKRPGSASAPAAKALSKQARMAPHLLELLCEARNEM